MKSLLLQWDNINQRQSTKIETELATALSSSQRTCSGIGLKRKEERKRKNESRIGAVWRRVRDETPPKGEKEGHGGGLLAQLGHGPA